MATAKKAVDATADVIQKRTDEDEDKGLHGEKVDPTPNEHYTVAGVTSGKPTPESDDTKAGLRRDQHHLGVTA